MGLRPLFVWMVILGAAAPKARATQPCSQPVDLQTLIATVDQAETAFGALASADFERASQAFWDQVPCLAEPVDPPIAARLHRLAGLQAYTLKDDPHVQEAFAAARRLAPSYLLPTSLVPEGHQLRATFDEALTATGESVASTQPPHGALRLDGSARSERLTGQATLAQWVGDGGNLLSTHYLWAADPWPVFSDADEPSVEPPSPEALAPPAEAEQPAVVQAETVPPAPEVVAELPEPATSHRRVRALRRGSAAAGAAALALGAVSLGSHQFFLRDPPLRGTGGGDALFLVNHITYGGMWATGVAAAGLGLGAVWTWRF